MDSMIINERINRLRHLMEERSTDALIVPTGDYHMSEYTAPYFNTRKYISGFTGSAGTAVITRSEAGLWTDSRYYLQAARELEGSCIDLYRMQEPGVPSITDFLKAHLKKGQTAAFDGLIVSCRTYEKWLKDLEGSGIRLITDADPIAEIWEDRPSLPCGPVCSYDVRFAGESRLQKISAIREDMAAKGADVLFISSLSDIAWLLNLRGSDVHCNPVFLSYLLISRDDVRLFAQRSAFDDQLADTLAREGITIEPYDHVKSAIESISAGTSLWMSSNEVSCSLKAAVPGSVGLIDEVSPTVIRKAVKNPAEQAGARNAHIRDGVAVTRWIYWLKQNVGSNDMPAITELSAAAKLYELRSEQEYFMGNSFDPIIAYGDHAAIVHYSADIETDIPIEDHGLLLADTGGQYMDGTTDITRTIALGDLTDDEVRMFTAVLRGHIDLAMAVFKDGCSGSTLDALAHLPLWSMGRDYGHGTGHGVGHFLNVHEGPNRFSLDTGSSREPAAAFRPGMITSDEPGYYEAGAFGIRHESLLLCREHSETEYGKFLCFDEITMVPFDLDAIDASMLTCEEKNYLNSYHKTVFETISPYLAEEEARWLRDATREI